MDDELDDVGWNVEDGEFYTECPACGELNDAMGRLGDKWHYCCRACGFWYYSTVKEKNE